MRNEATELTVGERLSVARKRADMTQQELAQKADTTAPAISMIEAGKRNPSLDLARRLAHPLDVTLDWLAYGKAWTHNPT